MRASTFMWFDGQAREAADLYTRLIPDAEIVDLQRATDGQITTVTFELAGQRYIAYNGGSRLEFGPGMSMYVECDTQEEIDRVWAGLTEGGQEGPGGSLVDRFGVTWQVLPTTMGEILAGAEPEAADRILAAVHAMKKINIQHLIEARR